MKFKVFLFALVTLATQSFGQESLVENPDFEVCDNDVLIENTVYDFHFSNPSPEGADLFYGDSVRIEKSADFLTAGAAFDSNSNNGNVVVEDGAKVLFQAGSDVFLEPGFSAKEGSEFSATVGTCESESQSPMAATSVIETTVEASLVYPNPTNSGVTIDLGSSSQSRIWIYNTTGLLVRQARANGTKFYVDMEDLLTAIYLIKIETDNGFTSHQIVKQ